MVGAIITETSPLKVASTAGAVPRYGIWAKSTPAMALNNSISVCMEVPVPPAELILPGLALASAMSP